MDDLDNPESVDPFKPRNLPEKLEAIANEASMAGQLEWAIVMRWAAHEILRLRAALGPREV